MKIHNWLKGTNLLQEVKKIFITTLTFDQPQSYLWNPRDIQTVNNYKYLLVLRARTLVELNGSFLVLSEVFSIYFVICSPIEYLYRSLTNSRKESQCEINWTAAFILIIFWSCDAEHFTPINSSSWIKGCEKIARFLDYNSWLKRFTNKLQVQSFHLIIFWAFGEMKDDIE